MGLLGAKGWKVWVVARCDADADLAERQMPSDMVLSSALGCLLLWTRNSSGQRLRRPVMLQSIAVYPGIHKRQQ